MANKMIANCEELKRSFPAAPQTATIGIDLGDRYSHWERSCGSTRARRASIWASTVSDLRTVKVLDPFMYWPFASHAIVTTECPPWANVL